MARVRAVQEGTVRAPAKQVYDCIADYRRHHPHIVPPAFSDLQVEQGGVGAGTIITFKVKLGGRTLSFRQRVEEPEPGRVLTESDIEPGGVTTFTVTPDGEASRVRIETVYEKAGIAGFVERLVAPRMLRRLYHDELGRLERRAQQITT